MLKKLGAIFLICLTFLSSLAVAVPLDTFQDFTAANPTTSRRGQWVQPMFRGTGTNDFFVPEIDPVTGAIPVSATIVNLANGTPGDPAPVEATFVGGVDENGDLRGISVDSNGYVNVNADLTLVNDTNYGTVGDDTLRTAAQIGNATGAADFNAGNAGAQTLRVVVASDQPDLDVVPQVSYNAGAVDSTTQRVVVASDQPDLDVVPQVSYDAGATDATTQRVIIATDQTAIPVSQSGQWDITDITGTVSLPTGAATESTLDAIKTTVENIEANLSNPVNGREAVLAIIYDYAVVLSPGTWTQISASTPDDINVISIFSPCSAIIRLGVGASTAEQTLLYIPPGGLDGEFSVFIPAGTRLTLNPVSGTCSSGIFAMNGFK